MLFLEIVNPPRKESVLTEVFHLLRMHADRNNVKSLLNEHQSINWMIMIPAKDCSTSIHVIDSDEWN